MLAEVARWRQEETGTRAEQLGREKTALATVESRLSRLLDVYLDGSISHEDYAAKKQEILLEKASIKERMARIREQGNAWLEPMESFLKDAIQGGKTANSENIEDLRDFYRKIGSNLFLIEPKAEETTVERRTRTHRRTCVQDCVFSRRLRRPCLRPAFRRMRPRGRLCWGRNSGFRQVWQIAKKLLPLFPRGHFRPCGSSTPIRGESSPILGNVSTGRAAGI